MVGRDSGRPGSVSSVRSREPVPAVLALHGVEGPKACGIPVVTAGPFPQSRGSVSHEVPSDP